MKSKREKLHTELPLSDKDEMNATKQRIKQVSSQEDVDAELRLRNKDQPHTDIPLSEKDEVKNAENRARNR